MRSSEFDDEYHDGSSIQSHRKAPRDTIRRPILATFLAALGPLSFGFSLVYSSSAVVDLKNPNITSSSLLFTREQGSWFSVSCFGLFYLVKFAIVNFRKSSKFEREYGLEYFQTKWYALLSRENSSPRWFNVYFWAAVNSSMIKSSFGLQFQLNFGIPGRLQIC